MINQGMYLLHVLLFWIIKKQMTRDKVRNNIHHVSKFWKVTAVAYFKAKYHDLPKVTEYGPRSIWVIVWAKTETRLLHKTHHLC
jgi:hypothetical protein